MGLFLGPPSTSGPPLEIGWLGSKGEVPTRQPTLQIPWFEGVHMRVDDTRTSHGLEGEHSLRLLPGFRILA